MRAWTLTQPFAREQQQVGARTENAGDDQHRVAVDGQLLSNRGERLRGCHCDEDTVLVRNSAFVVKMSRVLCRSHVATARSTFFNLLDGARWRVFLRNDAFLQVDSR